MRATINNEEQSLYPGTFVYLNVFITDQLDFIMVPPQAILEDQLGKFVYTVDANNTAKRTSVNPAISARYYVSVSKGLKDGDKVLISGLVKVKEGRKLSPKDVTDTEGVVAIMKKHDLVPQEVK
jgi:hypothetical protein